MKVFLQTQGCKLNYLESQGMSEQLKKYHYEIVKDINIADIVILNSCTVTNKADNKAYQFLKKAKKLQKKVVLTGCLATTNYDQLCEESLIDLVVKNQDKYTMINYLNQLTNQDSDIIDVQNEFPLVREMDRTRAYLKIQDGCNKFCFYCKIPFARGRSRSLSSDIVLSYAKALIKDNYKELVITGVNINDYKSGDMGMSDLIESILNLPGEFRVRLSSLQPDQVDDKLVNLLKHPKMANHFHLSLQSGCDKTLKSMNRHYNTLEVENLIKKIRDVNPLTGLTTDIIVGYPSENEEDFKKTLSWILSLNLTRLHIFPYSPREGTYAAKMKDMDMSIKRLRENSLRSHWIDTIKAFIEKQILGQEFTLLIETIKDGIATGYTANYLQCRVHIKEGQKENEFIKFRALSYRISMMGEIILSDKEKGGSNG